MIDYIPVPTDIYIILGALLVLLLAKFVIAYIRSR